MSVVTVAEVKLFLRVIHTDDDALLQTLIDAAEDEACRFCDRDYLPTLPVDYPPEYDSSSSEMSEDIPSSEDPIAPSVRQAIYYLVQSYYEASDSDEAEKLRSAARTLCFPYRARLGV